MTFQEWWIEYRGFDDPYKGSEQAAWNAAIEECAKLCDARYEEWWIEYRGFDDPYKGSEQAAWNAAIEECAKLCDARYEECLELEIREMAAAIRDMKEQE